MPLKLITAGGGSVILDANSTASTYTVNVPAQGGAMLTSVSGLNADNISSGTILKARMPVGSIIQVVEGSSITQVEGSYSSLTDLGIAANITPTSSSNKILIMVHLTGCGSRDTGTAWRSSLYRDATALCSFNNYTGNQEASGQEAYPSGSYLDSPGSTSNLTYRMYGTRMSGGANCYCIHNDSTNPRQRATITLMEVVA